MTEPVVSPLPATADEGVAAPAPPAPIPPAPAPPAEQSQQAAWPVELQPPAPAPAPPIPPRPEPVVNYAKLASATSATVVAGGAVFDLLGWATPGQVQQWAGIAGGIVTAVGALLAVILPIGAAYAARAQVTPLSSPQNVDGAPLVVAQRVSGADVGP